MSAVLGEEAAEGFAVAVVFLGRAHMKMKAAFLVESDVLVLPFQDVPVRCHVLLVQKCGPVLEEGTAIGNGGEVGLFQILRAPSLPLIAGIK